MDEVVVLARDVEDLQHARQGGGEDAEGIDVFVSMPVQPDGDEGLERSAHGGRVDICVDTAYDAARA